MPRNLPTFVFGATSVALLFSILVGFGVSALAHIANPNAYSEPLLGRIFYELIVLGTIAPIALGYFFILSRIQIERPRPSLKIPAIFSSAFAFVTSIYTFATGHGRLPSHVQIWIFAVAFISTWVVSFSGATCQYIQVQRYNYSFKPNPLRSCNAPDSFSGGSA